MNQDNGGKAAIAIERPKHLEVRQDQVRNDLAKLVLTLVDFLRQLLERQAIRRMEAGSLSDQQVEDLGQTFMQLDQELQRLKKEFGLSGEELNIDLGPLGRLI